MARALSSRLLDDDDGDWRTRDLCAQARTLVAGGGPESEKCERDRLASSERERERRHPETGLAMTRRVKGRPRKRVRGTKRN